MFGLLNCQITRKLLSKKTKKKRMSFILDIGTKILRHV